MNLAIYVERKFKAKMVTFGATIVMFLPLPLLQGNSSLLHKDVKLGKYKYFSYNLLNVNTKFIGL